MQPSNVLLSLVLVAGAGTVALLVRIDGRLRDLAATPAPAAALPAAPVAPVVAPAGPAPAEAAAPAAPATRAPSSDAAALLAAAEVLERRAGNDSGLRSQLLRAVRRIDPDTFFRELARLAATGSSQELRYLFQDDGNDSSLDRRYLPVLRQVADRLLTGGENSSYELPRIVSLIQRLDAAAAAPYVDEVVRRMVERGGGRLDSDNAAARLVLASGNAYAHALLLRGMRMNEYGGNNNEQTLLQIADVYADVQKVPVVVPEKRDQKMTDEDRKALQVVEQWIIANRSLLFLDRANGRMVLAKDAQEAAALRAKQPAWQAAAKPAPATAAEPASAGF